MQDFGLKLCYGDGASVSSLHLVVDTALAEGLLEGRWALEI